jgi:ABC-type multidrug transport system ATPase subunit
MDRASAERMLRLLADLRDQGRTIVLTTHQRELAEPIADVLLTMQNGALTQAASTHQPMETP